MDREVLHFICENHAAEQMSAALVTIVDARGSVPRKAGAQMLVYPDGRTHGTIGGGCGEAEVKRQAFLALDEKKSQLYTVSLLHDVAADEGMVCGGVMEVFIQILFHRECIDGGREK
ncbi:XdhC family protein [Anaerosinus massiliensis]|uniref:XdhC family protein n=1 Tax=Massilibacillus massiliensis TaxID=1806837 RepID=UPI000B28F9C0|nr:XdhC family protein [Massilibacillus massiliensis]